MSNILILSAGRRVELLQEFQQAAKALGKGIQIFAADMRPGLSSACQIADQAFILPPVSDISYASLLIELCETRQISMVIPTIDPELPYLSDLTGECQARAIDLIISDRNIVDQCGDKRETGKLFDHLGIPTPEIYQTQNAIKYPCFSKPYDGSSSDGAFLIQDESELTTEMLVDPKRMFMELIPQSYREITIDLYYDRRGDLKALIPRERLETRGGEVSKGVTRRDWVYDELVSRLRHIVGAKGCLTLQVFAGREDHHIQAIEINPRFGGGYPLTCAAGANFPKWLIEEYILGQEVEFCDDWEADLLMLRYDAKTLVRCYEVD